MGRCLVCVCLFICHPLQTSESFVTLLFVVKMVGEFEKASKQSSFCQLCAGPTYFSRRV